MFKFRILSTRWALLSIISIAFVSTAIFNSCGNHPSPPTLESQIASGKVLAQTYCTTCHELPDPALIDRKSWVHGVLPAMAKNLRIGSYMGQYYCDANSAMNIVYWQNIVAYYTNRSPVALFIPKPAEKPLNDWAIFSLEKPKKLSADKSASTTMLTFDSLNRKIYSGDVYNNLYQWDANLKSKVVHHFDSPVTGANYFKAADGSNTALITCIGQMAPINSYLGKVYLENLDLKDKKPALITDSLPRSVASVMADFNKDGLMDYVTCSFGHDKGGLYLLQQQPDHTFKKIIISSIAGGEQLITGDFNNDGWPDVMCLFAQADEGIRMFLNDHKGGFTTQTLLRFPPVYGSSSFQLVDFNHDGKPDILYTCGDNSDYSVVLKPYHGVYIFTNQGNWKFKQTYFYHINGCTKAIAADFAHDGKLDIAAIAYFADFKNQPQEGFTYLEEIKPNQFKAHQIPVENYGRWLTMAVADINNDGYDDVILGNFAIAGRGLVKKGFKPMWDTQLPLIVLKNNAGKKR